MTPEDEEIAPGWLPPRPADRSEPPPAPPAAPGPARAPGTLPGPSRRPAGPTDPLAPIALGLGIVAVLVLLLSAGAGFLFALPLAFAAWRVGVLSRRRIAAGGVGGDGLAQAAILVGLAAIGIAVVAMIAWAILSANGYTPEDLQKELERRSR